MQSNICYIAHFVGKNNYNLLKYIMHIILHRPTLVFHHTFHVQYGSY